MNIIKIGRKLNAILNKTNISQLSRSTGFIKRLRELKPEYLIAALIQTLGSRDKANLADIHRCYGKLSGDNIEYKPFHNQLKKASLTNLLKQMVTQAAEQWLLTPFQTAMPSKYPFHSVHIHDGSSLKLNDALAGVFPGRFTKTAPAAIELHMSMDLATGSMNYLDIAADKESERHYMPFANELKGTLSLMDAGYFDISWCHEADRTGGYYVVRTSNAINPEVIEAIDENGKLVDKWAGKKLNELALKGRNSFDLSVRWARKPGIFRLIAFWDRKTKKVGFLITNLSRNEFSIADILNLYGLRWQVELFFKELKSHSCLKTVNTKDPHIVKSLVWASMLSLLMKRYIAYSARVAHEVMISTQKVARCGVSWVGGVITSLLSGRSLGATLASALSYLAKNASRAHPKRDGETLLFNLGLPTYPQGE